MSPEIHLIVHNSITVISSIFSVGMAIFLIFQKPLKTVHWTLALTLIFVVIFEISHLIGVNSTDPIISRDILMWNLSVIAISVANFHCVMAALKQDRQRRGLVISAYILGAAFIVFYLLFPNTFLLPSTPKMYFPEYYVPGDLYWLSRLVFQGIIPIYFIYLLMATYMKSRDFMEKNRIIYFAVGLGFGWSFGLIPPLLIFNIQVDPAYGMVFPIFFAIPFMYAVLKYDLLDIRVIAKRAFIYSSMVAAVGIFIVFSNYLNNLIIGNAPQFPAWIMPLLSAAVAVAIGLVIWRQLQVSDLLKYEFITTVTHKFRTPLTHIKWASENLSKLNLPSEAKEQLGYIENANSKLVELTDVLVQASDSDDDKYRYKLADNDLSSLADESMTKSSDHARAKNIRITGRIMPGITASFDQSKVGFVMQTLIENGINYSQDGSAIDVSLEIDGKRAVFSVKDAGIGISKEELPRLFTKLYRGKRARSAYTEGMGIGLYISRSIIERQGGKIWAESDGEGKGSTFGFSLPLAI
ncbi:MAG: hypothetical protein KGI49_02355 [Patescibacteria group bacterium]|nr:hypothetical protein [Patescibacteria group bacterium]